MDGFFTIERNMIHFENNFLVNLLFSEKYEFGPQMTKIYIKNFFRKEPHATLPREFLYLCRLPYTWRLCDLQLENHRQAGRLK